MIKQTVYPSQNQNLHDVKAIFGVLTKTNFILRTYRNEPNLMQPQTLEQCSRQFWVQPLSAVVGANVYYLLTQFFNLR